MENIKCENCGGIMKKMDETTMKCEGCGATKNVSENHGEDKGEATTEESK